MAEPGKARPMQAEMPLGRDAEAVRRRVEAIERLLERSLHLPVVGPIGLDALIGLVPVAGDIVAGTLGLYALWEGRNLGMSKWQLARMAGNVGVDTLLGAIPLGGDLFDFLFRSNSRNLRLIRRHLDRHHPATRIVEG